LTSARDGDDLLRRIQSSLRAGIARRAKQVGPFLAHFDEHSDNPFRNYAVPDDGARPSGEEVRALMSEFAERGRVPRLEYVAPAPAVDSALRTAGFTVDLELGLMVLGAAGLREPVPPDQVKVVTALSEEDLWSAARAQHLAYGEPGEPTASDVARLRGTLEAGGLVLLALRDGEPAGAVLALAPNDRLSEIAAVGVAPEHQRRGIASTLVAEASRAVLTSGSWPYLQTETANEQRLYGRLGYERIGSLIATSHSGGRAQA
jgi:ribosomal protein S18 acetylase RimI-like enzyme